MRSILWNDWPHIIQHRRQLVCLDNILLLTRGNPFSLTHVLFAIRPSDHLFTGVVQHDGEKGKVIGQLYQSSKMSGAHINYLLPPDPENPQDLVALLEGLVNKACTWGSKQVVADLEIDSPYFTGFRQAGFSVLAKQKVFKCPAPQKAAGNGSQKWRIWKSADIHAMRCLYHTLVPPLVQPVEPMTRRETLGLVYYDEKGNLQAYADLVYGPIGVWILPVIHPQVKEDIADLLIDMLQALPDRGRRSIYITARSYQPWVEHAMLEASHAAEPGPEQALMVRYMALRQRVTSEFAYTSIENGCREPTIPLAPIQHYQD